MRSTRHVARRPGKRCCARPVGGGATDAVIAATYERFCADGPPRSPRDTRPGEGFALQTRRVVAAMRRSARPRTRRHHDSTETETATRTSSRRRARADGRHLPAPAVSVQRRGSARRKCSKCRCRVYARPAVQRDRGENGGPASTRSRECFVSTASTRTRDEIGQLALVQSDYTWITSDQGARRKQPAPARPAWKAATTGALARSVSRRTARPDGMTEPDGAWLGAGRRRGRSG